MKLTFILTRPAKRSGGDRYEAVVEGEDKPFVVYFPQKLSRPEGKLPYGEITVTLDR